jgi:hypothetical protein
MATDTEQLQQACEAIRATRSLHNPASVRIGDYQSLRRNALIVIAALHEQARGVVISRGQLEKWAGTKLTDGEAERIRECIPLSSIPEAIGDISFAVTGRCEGSDEK